MKKSTTFLFCFFFALFLQAQTTTDHIHIDQFGYLPSGKKVAVISDPQIGFNDNESYTPGSILEVVDAASNQVVYSASPVMWNSGATHDQSGDKGWWFDFSSVTTPGSYFIRDLDNNTISYSFDIDAEVYGEILKAAGRMFFYNRCNMEKAAPYAAPNWVDGNNFENPLQDANCRYVNDRNNASLEKDLTGGWFDAGDYNKYVTFASTVIHDLLNAYQENPEVFGDDWNIPESGNGFSDLIDEIQWELDWLKKMQTSTGEVHIKMGSIEYSDNAAAPPSANIDPRYYGPTCTSAAIALAGMFAHAAVVFEDIPGLAAEATTLKNLAELSWNAVLPNLQSGNLDENCDDGTIKAGDADRDAADQKEEALIAAIYLFEITGASSYGTYIINNILDATPVSGAWWGPYTNSVNEALLRYTTLASADLSTKNEIINSITPHVQGDWNDFFGMNDLDLYRSFMPEWSYHWGSNNVKAQYASLNQMLIRYNINPAQNASYLQKAEEQIHYYHGINPLNMVYLSNMYNYGAEKSANEIYHTWFNDGTDYDHAQTSLYGPAPGYVVGGANKDYSYSPLTPPFGQPAQKAYLDFNDGFPEASWEITEPAIYYQSAYIRMLAAFAPVNSSLPVTLSSFSVEKKDNDVQLDWTTATEMDSKTIAIERSTDAMNWVTITEIDAAGNSTSPIDYNHLDINPWNNFSTIYYRLKFIDLAGAFFYSEVKSVNRTITTTHLIQQEAVVFYPNPVNDFIQIVHPAMEDRRISIFDGRGVLVKIIDDQGAQLAVDFLPPGMYSLQVEGKGLYWKGRFVKI